MQSRGRFGWPMRLTALVTGFSTMAFVLSTPLAWAQHIAHYRELLRPRPVAFTQLKPGLTQTLSKAQLQALQRQQAARWEQARQKAASRPAVVPLSWKRMRHIWGRGTSYRNQYFSGTLPWQRSLRDVNLCNGNLFKSFTDIQVAPGRGQGLALQRTYNSDDPTPGPFGVGWMHCYDIRNQDEAPNYGGQDDQLNNYSDRVDFFGGRHKYHRDADGLYTPPPYLYDELSSDYTTFLINGPANVLDDTDKSMDGTIKHYIANGSVRSCDYIMDRFGNKTVLTYDQTITLPDGSHPLATVTDPTGRTLTFHTANLGTATQPVWRVVQVDGPQYSVAYGYGADGNLSSVTLDPGVGHLNRTTTYTYTSVSDNQGNTESGLLAAITDPLGHSVSYGYGLGYITSTGAYNPTFTNTVWVLSITEPGLNPSTQQATTVTWGITWSVSSGSIPIAIGVGNGTLGLRMAEDTYLRKRMYSLGDVYLYNTYFDNFENVIEEVDPAGYIRNPNNPYQPANGTDLLMTYGSFGNVLTEQYANYSPVATTTYYDASGYFQKQSVTDFNGHTTTFGVGLDSDPNVGNRGNVLWVRDAGYNDPSSPSYHKQYTYTYNQYGQKTSETNLNGVVTNYTYNDPHGYLTQVVQDVGGLHRTTTMSYDEVGHVVQSTDPMGQTSTFSYNVLGQLQSASFPPTAKTAGETVSYSYDANGRTTSVSDNRGVTSFTYAPGCDWVASVSDPVDGTISYAYGLVGQRLSMSLPNGGTWQYSYTASNGSTYEALPKDDPNAQCLLLWQVTDDQGRLVTYNFDELGKVWVAITNQVYTTGSNPTLVSYMETDYSYENHNWLTQESTSYHWQVSGGGWQSKGLYQNVYSYDNDGQRLTNQITDGGGNVRTEQYGYDSLNRLVSVNYGDGETQRYTFDAMGNRLTKQDNVSGAENYGYNNANMLVSRNGSGYVNDLDGNTLSGGGRSNVWDSENRLVSCNYTAPNGVAYSSQFTYGADGLRRRSVVVSNGVTNVVDTVYDASMPVEEIGYAQGTNTPYPSAIYLIGPRGPEYRRDVVHQSVSWYVYDGLGSVVEEVDPSGNITAARKYDVYGLVRSGQSGSSSQKYVGSLGHESEGNTGLIYMRARYMDPVLGRFISEDPSRDGVNWFVYCGDEPVNHVDPNGKIEWEGFLGALFIVIGGALMVAAYVFEAATLMVIGLVLFVAGLGLWAYDAYHTEDEVGKAGTNQVNKYVDKIKPWLNPDTNLITLEPIVDEIVTKLKTSGSVWLAIAGWDLELTFACLDTDAP